MMARERERTMSSDKTAFSSGGAMERGKKLPLVASAGFGRWFKGSNRNGGINNADDEKVIDLAKREGSRKPAAGTSENNNSKSASGIESVADDNGSVCSSSNSAFTLDEHQQQKPDQSSVSLNAPQDAIDGA
ncbi:hypothetical protein BGZ95_003455, partial [Linnemannia exigua]